MKTNASSSQPAHQSDDSEHQSILENAGMSGVSVPLMFQRNPAAVKLPQKPDASGDSSTPQKLFTVTELQQSIQQTSQVIVQLQQQIARGEETYYEETQQSHGSNLFKGFDTYIESRLDQSLGSVRRMPGDFRWFSSSCSNIAKYMKQSQQQPQKNKQSSGESNEYSMERIRLTQEQIDADDSDANSINANDQEDESTKKDPAEKKVSKDKDQEEKATSKTPSKRTAHETETTSSPRPKKKVATPKNTSAASQRPSRKRKSGA